MFHSTGKQVEYRHTNSKISLVQISTAEIGMRRVRIANLPSEVSDAFLKMILAQYEEVKNVHAETWSCLYRYPVANGIRLAMITLAKHIPSHITVAGNRVLVSYDGRRMTCYGCNELGHLYQAYPLRRRLQGDDAQIHPCWIQRRWGWERRCRSVRTKVGEHGKANSKNVLIGIMRSTVHHTI